jgi:hypothetical protein
VVTEGGGVDSPRGRQGDIEEKSKRERRNPKSRLIYKIYDKNPKIKEDRGDSV